MPCSGFNDYTTARHLTAALDHLRAALGEDVYPNEPVSIWTTIRGKSTRPVDHLKSVVEHDPDDLWSITSNLRDYLDAIEAEVIQERERREALVRRVEEAVTKGGTALGIQDLLVTEGYPDATVSLQSDGVEVDFHDE